MHARPVSAEHPTLELVVAEVLAAAPAGMTLNEVQAACGAPVALVSRALSSLEASGEATLCGRLWAARAPRASILASVRWTVDPRRVHA